MTNLPPDLAAEDATEDVVHEAADRTEPDEAQVCARCGTELQDAEGVASWPSGSAVRVLLFPNGVMCRELSAESPSC